MVRARPRDVVHLRRVLNELDVPLRFGEVILVKMRAREIVERHVELVGRAERFEDLLRAKQVLARDGVVEREVFARAARAFVDAATQVNGGERVELVPALKQWARAIGGGENVCAL